MWLTVSASCVKCRLHVCGDTQQLAHAGWVKVQSEQADMQLIGCSHILWCNTVLRRVRTGAGCLQ